MRGREFLSVNLHQGMKLRLKEKSTKSTKRFEKFLKWSYENIKGIVKIEE